VFTPARESCLQVRHALLLKVLEVAELYTKAISGEKREHQTIKAKRKHDLFKCIAIHYEPTGKT
jgi:hypothetical protein